MKSKFIIMSLASFLAAAVSAQTLDPRYTNTAARMTDYITNQMAVENIVGLGIALLDYNTTVWARGFGWADRELAIPVNTGTVFHIGSVSKVFGTTAVLKLWEDGLVDLDAPVTNYIPDFATLPRFPGAPPITVRMLLSHQSGLPGDILRNMFTVEPFPAFLGWLTQYLQTDYPAYPPSLVSVYCNSGFTMAEGVVRAASGMDFPAYARATLFDPLGMDASSYLFDRPSISNALARAYIGGERMPDEYISGYATGSMYASLPDLIRYLRMVNGGGMLDGVRYMTTNALAEMTADNSTNCPLNLSSVDLSGLGWDWVHWYELDYAGRAWIKSGGTMAYTAYIIALPDQQLGVAVVVNSSAHSLMQTAVETLRWAVLDKTGGALHWPTNTYIPSYSPVTNIPQPEIGAMAGIYINGDSLDELAAGPGTLSWTVGIDQPEPQTHSNLVPRVNGWFSYPDSQTLEMTVTNTAGYTVLMARRAVGPYHLSSPKGNRYTPSAIPEAWQNRVSRIFLIDNLHPLDYLRLMTSNFGMLLDVRHNILHANSLSGNAYLDPHDDDTAFVLGISNRGPGAIQAVRSNDVERLLCAGFGYTDASQTPVLPAGGVCEAALPGVDRWAWRRLAVRSGVDYLVRIASGDGCSALLCNPGADGVAWVPPNAAANWRADTNGTAYLGIYGDGHTAGVYRISLAIASHGGHDFDGDGKADPALAQGGELTAWLSGADYTPASMNLGDQGRAMLAADADGDGKADPVLVMSDGSWRIWLSASNYSMQTMAMGTTAGIPLLADLDGDGKADPLLIMDEVWYTALSAENYAVPYSFNFGLGAGQPAAADFDGDGKADPAMVNGAVWTAAMSGSGYAAQSAALAQTGAPCPGDFDGDGRADPAVFHDGWHVWLSGNAYRKEGPFFSGLAGIPVP